MFKMKSYLTGKEIENLKEKIMPYYGHGGHDFNHTQRVYNLAEEICKKEKANLLVIQLASLLHDIARYKEDAGGKCHALEGAKMAEEILKEENYDTGIIEQVKHCILVHRVSSNLKPESLEAKIIQDADRLDALGAICIARVFMYNGLHRIPMHDPKIKPLEEYKGQHTTAINHFYEKILKLEPQTFFTETARKIAEHRYKFIKEFLDEFNAEWIGER